MEVIEVVLCKWRSFVSKSVVVIVVDNTYLLYCSDRNWKGFRIFVSLTSPNLPVGVVEWE